MATPKRRDPFTGQPTTTAPGVPTFGAPTAAPTGRPTTTAAPGAPTARRQEAIPTALGIQAPGTGTRPTEGAPAPTSMGAPTAAPVADASRVAETTRATEPAPQAAQTLPPTLINSMTQAAGLIPNLPTPTTPEQAESVGRQIALAVFADRTPSPEFLNAISVAMLHGGEQPVAIYERLLGQAPNAPGHQVLPRATDPTDIFQPVAEIPPELWQRFFQEIQQPIEIAEPEPSALENQLTELLASIMEGGGVLAPGEMSERLTSAREPLDILRRAQQREAEAGLASRGLIGSGPQAESLLRIEEALAPAFAEGARQISADIRQREFDRFQQGLAQAGSLVQQQQQLATQRGLAGAELTQNQRRLMLDSLMGLTGVNQDQAALLLDSIESAAQMEQNEARLLLDTLNAITSRQATMTGLALQTLDRNIAWNQFLAGMGMDRAQFINDVNQGNLQAWLPILGMFQSLLQTSTGGFV